MGQGYDERRGKIGIGFLLIMETKEEIINRVDGSGLITFNLEDYYPKGERIIIDLKDLLFEGLILREKDLRTFIKEHEWTKYQDNNVAINCSVDAVIPTWAYLLLTIALQPYAKKIVYGNIEQLETILFLERLSQLDLEPFKDQRIVIKGCSNIKVPEAAYVEITRLLSPIAKSLMYGEPCSTVPLMKRI